MRDDSSTMFAGGIIVVIIVIMACLKAIQKIFIQMGQTFDAFGKMTGSFLYMAWEVILAIGLISLGIGCVFAAGYFSYKYYLMVRRGTEIKESVDARIQEFEEQMNTSIEELHRANEGRLRGMELKLHKALDKPALVPKVTALNLLPAQQVPEQDGKPSDSTTEPTPAQDPSPQNVHNPF